MALRTSVPSRDLIRTAHSEFFETHAADGSELINYVTRKPLGVVGIISPWNLPLLLFTWKVAPALAMGNCVVAKPSEETPSSATLLAEVMHDIGLPRGVFNLIHGHGPNAAGEFLTRHPDISAITFTGESRTGSTIMKTVADGVKEISFELGGKNAAVVFADADFDAGRRGRAQVELHERGPGVSVQRARVCRAADLRTLRGRAQGKSRSVAGRRTTTIRRRRWAR